jgi:tetratricopeptide (TPR) repeat protein
MDNNLSSIRKLVKLASILFFVAVIAISHLVFSIATSAQDASKRFDFLVREDIFAGLAGDRSRFDKAMKLCEETLAKNPKHAEAMVWHGGGVLTRAGWAFQAGDMRKGGALWRKGLDEMNAAVALEPDNIGVLIPRAAVLLEASKHVPLPATARELIETAVNDYEKVLRLQQSYFDKLSTHARGELLWALGSGWYRLGDMNKAEHYFKRLAKEGAGTPYAEKAQFWLVKKALSPNQSCSGCHAR